MLSSINYYALSYLKFASRHGSIFSVLAEVVLIAWHGMAWQVRLQAFIVIAALNDLVATTFSFFMTPHPTHVRTLAPPLNLPPLRLP